ncbi:hypothetical protein MCERE19_02252 [Spirosomataceae bacterium]
MKKGLFLILMLLGLLNTVEVTAQRLRTTAMFDGDIWTRPRPGMYGIGVRMGQPYLIGNTNDPVRIKVEHAYIVGVQLNTSGGIEYPGGNYQGRRTEYVSLNKDSLTVTLPSRNDTVNFNRNITFTYQGFSNALWTYFDNTYCVRFTDTVFCLADDQTYFFAPNTCIGSMTTAPSVIQKNLKPSSSFVMTEMDRRWYIHFNGIDY